MPRCRLVKRSGTLCVRRRLLHQQPTLLSPCRWPSSSVVEVPPSPGKVRQLNCRCAALEVPEQRSTSCGTCLLSTAVTHALARGRPGPSVCLPPPPPRRKHGRASHTFCCAGCGSERQLRPAARDQGRDSLAPSSRRPQGFIWPLARCAAGECAARPGPAAMGSTWRPPGRRPPRP